MNQYGLTNKNVALPLLTENMELINTGYHHIIVLSTLTWDEMRDVFKEHDIIVSINHQKIGG